MPMYQPQPEAYPVCLKCGKPCVLRLGEQFNPETWKVEPHWLWQRDCRWHDFAIGLTGQLPEGFTAIMVGRNG